MKLYRSIDVWRRMPNGQLARYRCFELLSQGRYCVQSLDFVSSEQQALLDRQFVELLSETAPDERAASYPTLEEAIAAHDREFADPE